MFGFGHRISRLEQCCEKFGNILDEHAKKKVLLEENLNRFEEMFKEHDKKEMKKYEDIYNELRKFNRIIWIAIGVGIAANHDKLVSVLKAFG